MAFIGPKRTLQVQRDEIELLIKSEESVPYKEKFCETTVFKIKAMIGESGLGPLKLAFKDQDGELSFMAFVGEHRIMLKANKSEKYHGLLALNNNTSWYGFLFNWNIIEV